MNRSAVPGVLFTALFLVGGAFGQQLTATFFTDTMCATMAASPLFGKYQNPLVAELNVCREFAIPKRWDNSTFDYYYGKAIACTSSGGFIYHGFYNSECYGKQETYIGQSGECMRDTPVPGIFSLKIECPKDPASQVQTRTSGSAPVSLAALIFAFVFAAICIQL